MHLPYLSPASPLKVIRIQPNEAIYYKVRVRVRDKVRVRVRVRDRVSVSVRVRVKG